MTEPQGILDNFLDDLYCQRLGRYPDPDAMKAADEAEKAQITRLNKKRKGIKNEPGTV